MNERVKKLAVEARLLTGWSVGEVEYQKFAELIIQESVQFLKDCNSEFEAEQLEEFWDL